MYKYILWATPSAAGPRLLIALGLQILGIVEPDLGILGAQTCHAWWLNFGVLGDPGTILGHQGAQQRTL